MKKTLLWLPALCLAFPLIHPFGPVRDSRSANSLPGDAVVAPVFERACQNCHSENTHWPLYSYLPFASWALEKDVADARRHLDLSHWDDYSSGDKQDLLARIAAQVRQRQMPLPRYLMLHPEARLSDQDIQAIYAWTKSERKKFRSAGE